MRLSSAILGFVVIALAVAVAHENELPLADACNPKACRLPDCRCSSTEIPGGLRAKDTPQFVTVTFDDAVNNLNILTYRDILYNRFNKNNCKAGATFYVSHEYSNYVHVNELYNNRFEIALHSISRRAHQTYWSEAKLEDMRKEFGEQKVQMSHLANIPLHAINGLRIPFLQMTGNASFQIMSEMDIAYDSSWPTVSHLWPYTLDYASTQECVTPPCPTASFPGTWVLPMISWLDLNGVACSMADACYWTPSLDDEDAWFQFMVTNFERHYLGNRAPFGVYLHEAYLVAHPAVKNALVKFLDYINSLNDVFMVNTRDVLEWVRNPIPVKKYVKKPCRIQYAAPCIPFSCGPLRAAHNQMDYWMPNCKDCPNVYPWLGNPLGIENGL